MVRLYDIAHGRSGDKGEITNISLFPYDEDHYEHLATHVTAAVVAAHFAGIVRGDVVRYEVDTLRGFNFVLHGTRPGGVSAALELDTHGKALSFGLLELEIPDVP
jgi:hypothetical protein